MKNDNIKIFLLNNCTLIIGQDDGKVIKNACLLLRPAVGPVLKAFMKNVIESEDFGIDLNKEDLPIIKEEKPLKAIAMAYEQIIEGKPIEEPKILTMEKPKINLN